MKILFMSHAVEFGGAEIVLLTLLKEINREKFDITVMLPKKGPLLTELQRLEINVKIINVDNDILNLKRDKIIINPCKYIRSFMNLKQTINEITQYILEEKFDLVFTNTIKADIYGSIAAKKAKTPVVWRLHDIITTNTFTFPLRILLKNLANRIPERIACVSNATSQSIIAQGVKPNKVITIYNGIDSDKFKHVEKVSVRSEFGISETSILIGIIARLTPWKGQEYFIRAIPSVVQKNRNVKFLIVGDAIYDSLEYKSRLYNLAEELDIKDYVIFTGFRTDIPNILNSLDIFVHASIEPDPFPTSILEAMAYRKCIIATKVGGVPEMIKSNYSGLLINPKSSNDISEAVIKIISNDSLRKQLADNAFLTVKEKFCLGKYVKSFEELFIRLGG